MMLSAVPARQAAADTAATVPTTGAWEHVGPAPRTVAECGLPLSVLEDLVLKTLRARERPRLAELTRLLCLSQQLCEEVVDGLVRRKWATVEAADSPLRAHFRFGLSEEGKLQADSAIRHCAYVGAAPIPVERYAEVVLAQRETRTAPQASDVRRALSHLVLPDITIEAVGQAYASGRPMMIYGPSGTGKTDIVVSLANAVEGSVVVPQALYAQGHIIEVLDAHLHLMVLNPDIEHADVDRRWREVRRPVAVAGGELNDDALELSYDAVRNVHVAPLTVRAQGGTLIVDDLGRQRASLSALLNRWIQVMEQGADTFSLQSSEVFTVPLDVSLVFSTNLSLDDLMDEAYLRRITYKVGVRTPTAAEFREITRRACEASRLQCDEDTLDYFVSRLFAIRGVSPKSCYGRDLVQTAVDSVAYRGLEPRLTPEIVEWSLQLYLGERANPAQ